MHPILADRQKLLVYLFAWLLIALLISALIVVPGEQSWPLAFAFSLPISLVYAFICLSGWYLCRAFPLQKTDTMRLLMVFLLSAAISSSIWVLLSSIWSLVLAQSGLFNIPSSRPIVETRLLFGIGMLLYLLAVAIDYLIVAFEESRDAERRSFQMKVLAQDAELRALRAQIDPHFLFNSLNSISALTMQNPKAARDMTIKLADFFRISLKLGAQEFITLEEELALIRMFLDIEKVRFGARLKFEERISENALQTRIPPLLLQPLVENAIRHGVAHLVEGGTIQLSTHVNGKLLNIVVENPVDPDTMLSKGTGVGLDNVRKRLHALYATDGALSAISDGTRFKVYVTFPVRK